jgi:hypothetical protein
MATYLALHFSFDLIQNDQKENKSNQTLLYNRYIITHEF